MEMVGYLTDVIGPRLTNSPNIKKAQEYAIDLLANGSEKCPSRSSGRFGRGWSLDDFTAKVTVPTFSSLIAYPKAWSAGTEGAVRGEVVFLNAKTIDDLGKYKGKLKGKIVLLSQARAVAPTFLPEALRTSDEELLRLANAEPADASQNFVMSAAQRASADLNFSKWQLVYSEGAAVVVEPGGGDGGTVYYVGCYSVVQ